MPRPVRGDQRYLPGLDGLRALAVAAVVAYHLNLGWAQGGLLGVGVFFTLSGYLITDILLGHWNKAGSLRLGDFWLRRARRLLPALFVMLVVVASWVEVADRARLSGLRGNVVASALYVSNWWYIAQHASYFAQFGPPSPLDHLWSLAVEEQFYLVWPWLLLLGLYLVARRRRAGTNAPAADAGRGDTGASPVWRYKLAAMTVAAAAASAAAMAAMYHPGFDPTRVYEGTDTRAFGLLIGAALAMVWPTRRDWRPAASSATWVLDACGLAGLGVILVMVWRTSEYSAFMFRGGMVLLSLATAAVMAAVVHPQSRLNRALGCGPLRWLGVRSYGIYLWHYPVIVLTMPPLGQISGVHDVIDAGASVVIAAVSWTFVEEPIRRGFRRVEQRRAAWRGPLVPALAVGVLALVVFGRVAADLQSHPAAVKTDVLKTRHGAHPVAVAAPATRPGSQSSSRLGGGLDGQAQASAGPPRTSCRSVVHIGDSTSEGLVSPDYLPNASQRITARYAAIGVTSEHMEISGGTSIVETLAGQKNAFKVASGLMAAGYKGCWVIALGTNDTADVYVGSDVSRTARIKRMMSAIGSDPVLWVTVKSLLSSGPYSEQDMRLWDQALTQELPHYPNMRVYDWSGVVQNGWFIDDGIHYTSAGYAQRARMIADALAQAFPGKAVAG